MLPAIKIREVFVCATIYFSWVFSVSSLLLLSFFLLDFEEPPQQAEAGQRLVLQFDRPLADQKPRRGRRGEGRTVRGPDGGVQQGQRDPAEEGRGQRHLEQVGTVHTHTHTHQGQTAV